MKSNEMNTKYLDINAARQLIGDEELVDEMLVMLHQSLGQDWQRFEALMAECQFIKAEKVLHQLRGVMPLFSDEGTADVLHHLDILLKDTSDEMKIQDKLIALQFRMQGFQMELNEWILKKIHK